MGEGQKETQELGREKEIQNLKQAPGSELSFGAVLHSKPTFRLCYLFTWVAFGRLSLHAPWKGKQE